jgi:hypothetical protein
MKNLDLFINPKTIQDLIFFDDVRLEYSDEDNPTMADSQGSLIDKLITVSTKMFWNQEKLYSIRKQSLEEFEIQWKNSMSDLHAILKRCTDLNVQRSRLVDEIDSKLAAMLNGRINPNDLVNPQHKTY